MAVEDDLFFNRILVFKYYIKCWNLFFDDFFLKFKKKKKNYVNIDIFDSIYNVKNFLLFIIFMRRI